MEGTVYLGLDEDADEETAVIRKDGRDLYRTTGPDGIMVIVALSEYIDALQSDNLRMAAELQALRLGELNA